MNDKTKTQLEAAAKVEDAEKALSAITETEKGIAKLKEQYGGVVFDVGTTKGMTEAKAARQEIRQPRYTIENLRKAAKAPILALGKTVDSIARELTEQVLAIETPIDEQIKAEETRKAEEKRLAEEAEEKRVDDIKARITEMHDGTLKVTTNAKASHEFVERCISGFMQLQIDDSFAEFQGDAQQTFDACLAALKAHSKAMLDREVEEQRIAEERAELEQLRKEKEERDAADQAEAKRKADIKAEMERKAAAIPTVERQFEALGGGQRAPVVTTPEPEVVEDTVAAAEKPKQAFPPYPGDAAIVNALATQFKVVPLVAQHWLLHIKGEQV